MITLRQYMQSAGQAKPLEVIINEYIASATCIHNERMQSLVQANKVITQEYITIDKQIALLKEDKGHLNHEIDSLISSFSIIDNIESDIAQTEANIEQIFKAVNRINKRIVDLKKKGKK